jgi:hypothetical protein
VDRVKLAPGFHVPLLWNAFKDESLQSFVLQREAKPDQRPWFQYRITPEKAVWRNSSAIIHGVIRGEETGTSAAYFELDGSTGLGGGTT